MIELESERKIVQLSQGGMCKVNLHNNENQMKVFNLTQKTPHHPQRSKVSQLNDKVFQDLSI